MRSFLYTLVALILIALGMFALITPIAWWVKAETDRFWLPYVATCEAKGGVPEWGRYTKAQCWDKVKGTRIFW